MAPYYKMKFNPNSKKKDSTNVFLTQTSPINYGRKDSDLKHFGGAQIQWKDEDDADTLMDVSYDAIFDEFQVPKSDFKHLPLLEKDNCTMKLKSVKKTCSKWDKVTAKKMVSVKESPDITFLLQPENS